MRRIAKVRCGVMVAAAVMAVRSVGAQAPAEGFCYGHAGKRLKLDDLGWARPHTG